jgi:hypothetical protein
MKQGAIPAGAHFKVPGTEVRPPVAVLVYIHRTAGSQGLQRGAKLHLQIHALNYRSRIVNGNGNLG